MNINLRHIIIALAALLGITTSCTDEVNGIPSPGADGGLTLLVPDAVSFRSRTAGDNGEAELKYSSLYLFAFPRNGSGRKLITPLAVNDGSPGFTPGGYRSYPLQLEKGEYVFYLVANRFAAGTDTDALPQTEGALKDELLYFDDDFDFMIPAGGIPMSASPSDFTFRSSQGGTSSANSFTYNGQSGTLVADMTFCYAKVTLIPQDAAGDPAPIADLAITRYSAQMPVIDLGSGFDGYGISGPADITKTVQGKDAADRVVAHTFYIPERYITGASATTVLTMKIDGKEIAIPVGQTDAMTEPDETYIVPGADELPAIIRGHLYRYTLTTTDKFNVIVEPWSPKELVHQLDGPVYLHLEKQEYAVAAGEETSIWYDSSVKGDLSIESPKYTVGTTVYDLYDYSVNESADTLRVWVNNSIPSAEYTAIKESIEAGEGKYDYFHIVAGNLRKRIAVSPLSLDYYLHLNPEAIALDVKLRVASGEYDGSVPVSIRSNYPQIRVSLVDGWDRIATLSDSGDALGVYFDPNADQTVTRVTMDDPVTLDMEPPRMECRVKFSGMNSGLNIWKENRELTFEVAGLDENGEVQVSIPVTITIIPSILNYKIHFKAAANNWVRPHIYIYQCLEFPGDYTGEYNKIPLANKPIGYISGDSRFAALEYSFSGAISFRGWDFPINHYLLYYDDGSQKPFNGSFDTGFYIFGGDNSSWDVQNDPTGAAKHYNYDYDFCKEHREEVSSGNAFTSDNCPACRWLYNNNGLTMNRLWPGIMMKREESNDGWYEFELTGIAEPGKTLIMFADNHKFQDVKQRFPDGDQVGVPLFDYPSREGWFLFNGDQGDRTHNNFSPTKPGSVVITNNGYRIYWPTSLGRKKVHIWINGGNPITDYDKGMASNYSGVTADSEYYFYDFNANVGAASKFGIIFYNNDSDKMQYSAVPVTVFATDTSVGRKCAWFDGTGFVPGAPSSTIVESNKYRVYWPASQVNSDQACLWVENGDNDVSITGWDQGRYIDTYKGYRYIEFEVTVNSNQAFGYVFHTGNNKFNDDDRYVEVSKFTIQPDGVKCAYFDGGGWYSGIPTSQFSVRSDYFTLYWPKSINNGNCSWLYWWPDGPGWAGKQASSIGNYYYLEFDNSNPSAQFNFIFNNNGNWQSKDIEGNTLSIFSPVGSKDRNCAFILNIDAENPKLQPGLPPNM